MEDRDDFKEHIEKYNDLRNKVYAEIPKVINMPGVKLTPINSLALSAYLRWPNNDRLPPNGGWDWSSWVKDYRKKHPKRFEAAIWFGGNLCGLLLGRMSGKNIHVRLEVLEGSTDINHPLENRGQSYCIIYKDRTDFPNAPPGPAANNSPATKTANSCTNRTPEPDKATRYYYPVSPPR